MFSFLYIILSVFMLNKKIISCNIILVEKCKAKTKRSFGITMQISDLSSIGRQIYGGRGYYLVGAAIFDIDAAKNYAIM